MPSFGVGPTSSFKTQEAKANRRQARTAIASSASRARTLSAARCSKASCSPGCSWKCVARLSMNIVHPTPRCSAPRVRFCQSSVYLVLAEAEAGPPRSRIVAAECRLNRRLPVTSFLPSLARTTMSSWVAAACMASRLPAAFHTTG